MSEDRTLFWGTEGEHNYASGEGGSGPPDGNFVVAETDAGTRLFEWDGTQWVSRGAVNMDGNDIEGVGSLTTESASIGGFPVGNPAYVDTFDLSSPSDAALDDTINFDVGDDPILLHFLTDVRHGGDPIEMRIDDVETEDYYWTTRDIQDGTTTTQNATEIRVSNWGGSRSPELWLMINHGSSPNIGTIGSNPGHGEVLIDASLNDRIGPISSLTFMDGSDAEDTSYTIDLYRMREGVSL